MIGVRRNHVERLVEKTDDYVNTEVQNAVSVALF
jgi:hypothetical protein